MNKQGNLRLILAVAISFLIIFVWSYYFQENKKPNATTNETVNVATDKEAPKVNVKDVPSNLKETTKKPLLTTIDSNEFSLEIDTLGRISQVYLKNKKFTQPPQEGIFDHIFRIFGLNTSKEATLDKLAFFDDTSTYPLEIRFIDSNLNKLAFQVPYTSSASHIDLTSSNTITLTQDLGEVVIEKILTLNKDLTYKLEVKLNKEEKYLISNGSRPIADGNNYAFNGVILQKNDDKLEKIEDGNAKVEGDNFNNVRFISSVDRYYTSLFYSKNSDLNVTVGSYDKKLPLPFVNADKDISLYGFIGPKDFNLLKSIDPVLVNVVEYGYITFFAKYIFILLEFLHDYTYNWGFAIILLTIIIRILLFPLTFKGMVGMQKLKDIAPQMKEIQTKYKGDPQKIQASMMELYKKHGANPIGGCLPLLLQIPVFFAIYRVLYNAVELKNADFLLWITDLSVMDPYFVLPILMGLSMYVQQALTPSTFTDPMQQKIFKYLPVVFTIFLITFPAGLTLYWTINNVLSIVQQLAINKMLDAKKTKEIEIKEQKNKIDKKK